MQPAPTLREPPRRHRSVNRRNSEVARIDEAHARHETPDGEGHRQPAHTGIENTDRTQDPAHMLPCPVHGEGPS